MTMSGLTLPPCDGPSLTRDGYAAPWFGALMVESGEATGTKLTATRIRVYAADLADLDPLAVVAAFRRVRREGSGFFPSVSEIRRQVEATPDDAALLAWTALERAADEVGAYRALEVWDAAAAVAVEAVFGSWPAFCACERGPELAQRRQQFMVAYREARRRVPERLAEPRRLPGLHAASGRELRGDTVGRVLGAPAARRQVTDGQEG